MKHVSVDIRFELIHWALWRTLMRTEYFFVRSPHHKHFGKAQHLVLWVSSISSIINCSLLVNPSHTDESWEGRNMCLWIYIYNIYNIYIYIYIHLSYLFAVHPSGKHSSEDNLKEKDSLGYPWNPVNLCLHPPNSRFINSRWNCDE